MKKKTHQDYVAELRMKNPTVIPLGEYIDAVTKIEHMCLKHGIAWFTTPSRALDGRGCEKCKKEKFRSTRSITDADYRLSLNSIFPNVVALELYTTARTPIKHLCITHNFIWKTAPASILCGHGCPKCSYEIIGKKNSKTLETYAEELKVCNPQSVGIGDFKNSTSPALHKCLIDNHTWYTVPSYILSGRGCPKCKESVGERQVRQWLDSHNIKYEQQKTFPGCVDIKLLPFDFYLPEHRIAIEYDGAQHYQPIEFFGGEAHFNKVRKHDMIKDDYCNSNQISLLRIRYDEIVSDKLNSSIYLTQ